MSDPLAREMSRSMEDLDNLARDQQQLRDETFRQGQERRMQDGRRPGDRQPGRQGQQRGPQGQRGQQPQAGEQAENGENGDLFQIAIVIVDPQQNFKQRHNTRQSQGSWISAFYSICCDSQ